MLKPDAILKSIPAVFQRLLNQKCIAETDITFTPDGFYAVKKPIDSILFSKGIETFPGNQDQILECRNFFDDWYLYAVSGHEGHVYSLFKMREQEFDAEKGLIADGDTPGVTVSFIEFHTELLEQCLLDPDMANRKILSNEINRVVAYSRQQHHPDLKAYFIRPEAEGPYLIGELYTQHIASYVLDGVLSVPKAYAEIYKKRFASRKYARIPDFIDANNAAANRIVCDHEKIYIQDANHLTIYEKMAILATHTANVSFHSFAAEVRFHAKFLVWYAKVSLPFLGGSVYASAVRADMTIDDKEFEGPTPYYNLSSRLVKKQMMHHR